jgi:hypothetical protein
MKIVVFLDVTPCTFLDRNERFGEFTASISMVEAKGSGFLRNTVNNESNYTASISEE